MLVSNCQFSVLPELRHKPHEVVKWENRQRVHIHKLLLPCDHCRPEFAA